MSRTFLPRTLLTGIVLILGACSTTPSAPASVTAVSATPMASEDDPAEDGFAWGAPAEAGDSDRVVEITMLDELRFDPAAVEVAVGETVTFSVTNAGQLPHDFTLGDEQTQTKHEAEMAESMDGVGHDEPNVLTLEAGASGELTWRFTEPARLLFGCHIPGHYDAGMVGTLTVSE